MKISPCLFIMAVLGVALAQDQLAQNQTYMFTDGPFNHRVIIYSDVAVGETAIEIVTADTGDPVGTTNDIVLIIGLIHAGLDSDGTLHLIRTNNDYQLGSKESFEISTSISEPVSFGGVLGRPFNVDLDIQPGEGSKLNITLTNADIFEVVKK
jgi:hypothetical protein